MTGSTQQMTELDVLADAERAYHYDVLHHARVESTVMVMEWQQRQRTRQGLTDEERRMVRWAASLALVVGGYRGEQE